MFDIDVLRGLTPATIRAAFNRSEEILEEHGDAGNTNVTGIMTRILQCAGRFSERWTSDCLYGLDKLRALAGEKFTLDGEKNFDEVISFGIREDGVDHNDNIMSNLLQSRSLPAGYVFPKRSYRRILAVRMRAWADKRFYCVRVDFSLRDITSALYAIDPVDLVPGDQFKLVQLPNENKTSPEPTDEKFRTDQVEIRKLKEEGYKTFSARDVTPEELEKDGCSCDVKCIEIGGLWDPAVPPAKDPASCAVCRVYLAGEGRFIVTWINDWYRYYDDVKKQIERAKAALLDAATGDGKEAADGAD